jgi:VWFA-related protein
VYVQLVQVTFLASDQRGRPVTDLRPDEIEILERGQAQKLAFLEPYYTRAGSKAAPPVPGSRAVSPNRWVVLFLDAYTSSVRTRVKSLEAIREFVESRLTAQDRAAIAVFDGKLDLVQTFSNDKAVLMQAASLASSRLERSSGDRAGAVDDLLEEMEACRSQGQLLHSCAQRVSASYEDARLREARDTVFALTTLTHALGSVPDVKAVILFSDGFAREPFSDAFDAARATLGYEAARRLSSNVSGRLDRDLAELVAGAASTQVSFFTIYPGGGAGESTVSATRGDMPSERRNPENIDVYRRSEQNFGQGLVEVARRTGGHFSQGTDVRKQLNAAWELSSGLYSAGYYLGAQAGSRSGEIRIRCHRKGVTIESRREAPVVSIEGGVRADIQTSLGTCENGSRRSAQITVSVDPRSIDYRHEQEGRTADLSVYLSVLDPATRVPLWEDYRFLHLGPAETAVGETVEPPRVEHTLRIPCRPLAVRAFVVDVGAGRRTELTSDLPL